MEFLRFGSSIPGTYWGCCACCIIQNFKFDPDQKTSIQMVSGDSGTPMGDSFAGPTYRDIFNQRIRTGTFSNRDMPNHAFLAILTSDQISAGVGKKWLIILKEAGFEFIRATDNSVYSGADPKSSHKGGRPNYLFGLFRNIGAARLVDPFTPPREWTDLPYVGVEPSSLISFNTKDVAKKVSEEQTARWNATGPTKFLTEAEVVAAGAPVIYAGLRSRYPQQDKHFRDQLRASDKNFSEQSSLRAPKPVPTAPAPAPAVQVPF